jgi:hypothetical protein
MNSVTSYDNLVDNMNAKEKELQNQIEYYRTNMEQLIRIKYMEAELDKLKKEIEIEYRKRCLKQRQSDIQIEYLKYCKDNCKKAFDTLMYQNKHNEMMNNRTNNKNIIHIDVQMSGKIVNGTYSFQYAFDKFDNIFNVTCVINGDIKNQITGIYSPDTGFVEK